MPNLGKPLSFLSIALEEKNNKLEHGCNKKKARAMKPRQSADMYKMNVKQVVYIKEKF